jgi:hypothetical protein
LFAIVTLAGEECDEVVSVQRLGTDDHVVTCLNGRGHRVHTVADGRVRVDPHSIRP